MTKNLERLLEIIIEKISADHQTEFMSFKWMHYPEMKEIKEELSNTHCGKMFDNQLQSLGNGGQAV